MAVPSRKQDGQVAYPELSTLICGPCKDGGEDLAAVGYCVDCNEYYCELCFKHHYRGRAYKYHRLQHVNEIPGKQLLDAFKTNVNACSIHKEENVRLYCRTHRELGCGRCINKNHKSCKDIVDVCDEYDSLDSRLKQLKQEYTEQAGHAEAHIPRIEKIKEDAVGAIKKFHREIIDISNKLENACIEEVEKFRNKDDENIKAISEMCSYNLKDIDFLSTDLSKLYNGKRTGALIMKMEEKRSKIVQLETNLRTIHRDITINEYRFEPSRQLSTTMQCINNLGRAQMEGTEMKDPHDVGHTFDHSSVFSNGIQSRSQRSYTTNKGWIVDLGAVVMLIVAIVISSQISNTPLNKPMMFGSDTLKNEKFEYMRDIGLTTGQDSKTPWVTGLGPVSESRLILVDNVNQKVMLLDTKLDQIASELVFVRNPVDVSIIDEHKAAVTLPGVPSIQFVTISDTLSLGQKIYMRDRCYDITYWDNKLAVTCESTTWQWRLDILDLTGHVLNSITPEHNGQLLFGSLRYVIVTGDQELYVSDYEHKAVYRLSMQGDVKAIYKHPAVEEPYGLTVGPGGTVYFCDRPSDSVYQLDPNNDDIQKVLGRENNVEEPRSISYIGNKLYVGTDTGKVQVFHWK